MIHEQKENRNEMRFFYFPKICGGYCFFLRCTLPCITAFDYQIIASAEIYKKDYC